MPVRMELSRILIRELNDFQVIELREVVEGNGEPAPEAEVRSFPIVIGLPEAQAIERRLKGIPIKRPQTHDLLANVVNALGGELVSISVTDLNDHTYYATLDIRTANGELIHVDARPSDAIALGIAGSVPIYVEESVIESASRDEA
ncbi:MAG TPA: bifunctional nuclease family protein [Phycisphaerales bacterium]|nr:bifunctional nuclease family protein [Phycisphaerales bacterium]